MTYIPDCREGEYYNQKYLNEKDKQFVAGFDWAVERISELFRGNINVFPELEELLDDNTAVIRENKEETVKNAVEEWAEMERDELITSMIDGMSEEEYTRIKASVDSAE